MSKLSEAINDKPYLFTDARVVVPQPVYMELLKAAKAWEELLSGLGGIFQDDILHLANYGGDEDCTDRIVGRAVLQALNLYKAAPENEFDRVIGPVAKSYAQEK